MISLHAIRGSIRLRPIAKGRRRGFTLIETILFLGIFAMMSSVIVAVLIATQEARIRQQYIAETEQRGTLLLSTMTRTARRSEAVLSPVPTKSGSILALQMAKNGEYPTIFARTATGRMLLVQKTSVYDLLDEKVSASNFNVRNSGGNNVIISFDLQTIIPVIPPKTYTQHFESAATLLPDDKVEGGGCGTCPAPSCTNHVYQWYHCAGDACAVSPNTIAC